MRPFPTASLLRLTAGALASPVGVLTYLLMAGSAGPGNDGFGYVTCDQRPRAGCDVKAMSPASDKSTSSVPSAKSGSSDATSRVCHDLAGGVAPCVDPALGSMGADHCYYRQAAAPSLDLQGALGGAGSGPGGWYDVVCPGLPGTGGGLQWLPAGAVAAPAVDPAALARQAVSRLQLPGPVLGMSPARAQMVGVPTWLWIAPGSWRPRSATATVPGVAVTATASPARAVWSMGDRSVVTCTGPGTPWPEGGDPTAASPTCGHTYARASDGVPGHAFAVTVTLTWSIRWAGGGQAGVLPEVSTTTGASVRVEEIQAVVVGG